MNELIEIRNEKAFADSLQIAKHFGKQHKSVIKSIEKAITDTNSRLKIVPSKYINERGKEYKMYLLDRDAFSFIVMGFTGSDATEWKLKYIEAFNKMESIIVERNSTDWQLTRENGKLTRRNETDIIAKFVLYAESQGSKSANKYYIHFTKLVNNALGIKQGERDSLSPAMLAHIATFEDQVTSQLVHIMESKKYYKDIYEDVKQKIKILTEIMIIPSNKYLPLKEVA